MLFITFGCQICLTELSANAALTSNYVWRGETLSDDSFALQGGANWSNESGIYAEIWGSTTDDGTDTDIEYDLYAGYNIEMDAATIDIGLVRYDLIDADDADVIEFISVALLDLLMLIILLIMKTIPPISPPHTKLKYRNTVSMHILAAGVIP